MYIMARANISKEYLPLSILALVSRQCPTISLSISAIN